MLRNVSVFACLVMVAIGLVAASEPQPPTSEWTPATQSPGAVYRPVANEALAIEAAQTSGSSSLADRLRAVRGGTADVNESAEETPEPASAEPGALPEDPTSSQLPSVLVRRPRNTESTPQVPPADVEESVDTFSREAADAESETADSMRRTARRPRNESPVFRAPGGSGAANSVPTSRSADTNSLNLKSPGPTIIVETEGPRAIAVNKPANYRVRVTNQGTVEAAHLIVTVALPTWAQITASEARVGSVSNDEDADLGRRIVWDLQRVGARSQQELALSLQPTENRPIDLAVEWVVQGESVQASIEVQQPQLALAVEGPSEMRFGSTSVFKINLTNPGNGPADNVVVTVGATGIANQPNTVGTLGAGESRSLEVELTAQQAGSMKIEASAQGDGNLTATAAHDVRVRRAQLGVKVTAPPMLYAGGTALYEIRVANTGDAPAEGVTLELQLPAGSKNAIGVDKKPLENGSAKWRLGDLPAGADRVYTMQCELLTGGECQFVAQVRGTDDTQASDTAVTTVEALADLKLVVNDPKGPVPVGREVTYEIQIINRGSKEATNINLVAQFSEGIEPTSASGHASELVPGQVIFKPIASLPAGGQLTVKVVATAQKAGNLRFRAELSCGEPDTKLASEETTRFYGAAAESPAPQAAERPTLDEPTPARR